MRTRQRSRPSPYSTVTSRNRPSAGATQNDPAITLTGAAKQRERPRRPVNHTESPGQAGRKPQATAQGWPAPVLARAVLARAVLARAVLARAVLARAVLARAVLARAVLAAQVARAVLAPAGQGAGAAQHARSQDALVKGRRDHHVEHAPGGVDLHGGPPGQSGRGPDRQRGTGQRDRAAVQDGRDRAGSDRVGPEAAGSGSTGRAAAEGTCLGCGGHGFQPAVGRRVSQ